jgi:hypothetical protein
MPATIRLLPRDGAWVTLGARSLRGIVPEGIEATANPWGPDQLSFQIKALDPRAQRPDLLPYTPIELEIDGLLVWAGRIRERPADERAHQVACEGWQYHLFDDLLSRVYVHTRLGDYRDQRSFLGADLTLFLTPPQVQATDGAIVLGWPEGANGRQNTWVGVTFDLGPDSTAKRVVLSFANAGIGAGTHTLKARAHDGENPLTAATFDDALSFDPQATASPQAGTFTTARRYVSILLTKTAATGLEAADRNVRITAVQIFRDTVYESGNASVLKADEVVKTARDTKAPLLNPANDLISAGTFNIPEYASAAQSPREIIEAINAYENYETRIAGPDLKTLRFRPKATAPLFAIGEWTGSDFTDASAKGDDIYDQVLVTGTGPDGANLQALRTQTGTLVDLRGFHRTKALPIATALTSAIANRFGDLWLLEHRKAAFSGRLTVRGNGVRRMIGHGDVPPHELLLHANELVHFSHRVDPDTGAWGRDGRIASVAYNYDNREAAIAIDDRRDHFETILARYGLLAGQL